MERVSGMGKVYVKKAKSIRTLRFEVDRKVERRNLGFLKINLTPSKLLLNLTVSFLLLQKSRLALLNTAHVILPSTNKLYFKLHGIYNHRHTLLSTSYVLAF